MAFGVNVGVGAASAAGADDETALGDTDFAERLLSEEAGLSAGELVEAEV